MEGCKGVCRVSGACGLRFRLLARMHNRKFSFKLHDAELPTLGPARNSGDGFHANRSMEQAVTTSRLIKPS